MRFRPITTRLFNVSDWRQSVASALMRRKLSRLRRSSQVCDGKTSNLGMRRLA